MTDFSGYPLPDNCPEAGECIRVERPEPGLAVVILDPPHRSLAVLDAPLIRDLDAVVEDLEQDTSLNGIVLTGRAPGQFAAGADIDAIAQLTDPKVIEKMVLAVHELFNRIEDLKPRTVAAISGPVPGGAFEISLACDLIVASDDDKTRIGLPETQLGILPGWGGSHRLPKRIGLPLSLDAILTGRLFKARVAWKRGMVDRIAKPEYLLEVAKDIAMGRKKLQRKHRGWKAWAMDKNPLMAKFIASQARKTIMKKTRGKYPAVLRALDMVIAAPSESRESGARKEAIAIAELASGPVCKALVSIFKGSEAAKKLGKGPDGWKPSRIEHGAVIGGGIMGGGIASAMADRGIWTRICDLSADALDAAVMDHRKDIDKRKRRRRIRQHQANEALDHLDMTLDSNTLGKSQVVIEAVAEVLPVKQKVLGGLAEIVSSDCIIATNTSSLSVTAIANDIPNPERVVGMHFFNPVKRMPLVEVIRGEKTSDEVVSATCALALRLGKTPVVVKDVAGFQVNRLLAPYLDEAMRLFVAGADPSRMDRLMLDFGMPMGPFTLIDEVGFDIALHTGTSLHEAYGTRFTPCPAMNDGLGENRLGKKTGKGFYVHPKGKKAKPSLATDLAKFQTETWANKLNNTELVDRMVLSMVGEAARCLEEGVTENAQMLDLATVFGTGFAPFHGGVLGYADSVGTTEVVKRLNIIVASPEMTDREGGVEKFTPAKILIDLAASGGKFRV